MLSCLWFKILNTELTSNMTISHFSKHSYNFFLEIMSSSRVASPHLTEQCQFKGLLEDSFCLLGPKHSTIGVSSIIFYYYQESMSKITQTSFCLTLQY